jgi:phospho-N-acetylmuramoyl-pentapeptide-transferase
MIHGNVDQAFLVALCAFLASAVAAPFIFRALVRAKSRQQISEFVPEHAAKQGTPTMGGLVILVGLAIAFFFVPRSELLTPLILVVGFAFIGLLDDYIVPRKVEKSRGLGWKEKLMLQVVVAVGAYLLGGVRDWKALGLLTFAVLFFANAYNFVDGMDALAGGIAVMVAVAFAVIGRLSIGDLNVDMAVLALMSGLAASTLPFLYYNAPPAKMFMGDVGALPIGALLGWTFMEVGRPSELVPGWTNLIAASVVSLVFVVELVPVPLQIISVKLRKGKRLFPRTPIHHAFQHGGWPETRVVWAFHLAQAVFVAIGLGILWRAVG